MKREELQKILAKNTEWVEKLGTDCVPFNKIIMALDLMEEELDSRTCNNCKYFLGFEDDSSIDCQFFGEINCNTEFDNDFGCNKFERKAK